jgi:hypothetical protein
MSRYVHYYNTRQIMYKDMATRWKRWSANLDLSELEVEGVSMFFRSIGKRFGLLTEFKEIGVI